ncbi:MAG: multifunctional CCA addition/repair protein [endosymbiont of Galathealinum brachiosum]|uniref:Multifunctional CCA protein n=1 Tax=endosymbiont of Galathealinum brachiosum TaxID=2200906 RepID=A0A370DDJ8_9GAMM|nr:MAG: multifunctional CCA addition/repair protein [endosymbiont of Galathealinum brachiosum]
MKIYLVGGAVRDELLDYPFIERDWVVVGATVNEMLELGYQQVGKDFPVFLHPETKDEHALARTERNTAPGYKGFEVHASPDVTLEEDLIRRDLTINAIAKDKAGNLVDPYNGQTDLKEKLLRHVSSAFSEDPVRILRVARFAARYAHLGFSVADETLNLMQKMVSDGEADALVAERVWQEFHKALGERNPEVFIQVLRDCGALKIILPEIDALFGVPQPKEHHPEIDTGIHTLMVLQQAALLSTEASTRFAALCHDLGKALTPQENWPSHHGHEIKGVKPVKQLCKRLRIPNNFNELACITAEFHLHVHRAFEIKKSTLLKTIEKLDGMRKPERYEQFLLACTADIRGRTGYETHPYPQANHYRDALKIIKSVDIQSLKDAGLQGKDMADAIHTARQSALNKQLITPENI